MDVAGAEPLRIHIRGLTASAIIGVRPKERERPQDIAIDLALDVVSRAGRTDSLSDAVDYKRLKDAVLSRVRNSRFQLIEALASSVADLCLRHPQVRAVEVTVDKLGALTGARSVAVSLRRQRVTPPVTA